LSKRYGVGMTTAFAASVTTPIRANALPFSDAPVLRVIDWSAMMVPLNPDVVPSAAELPTCQKTFDALAPPLRTTARPEDAVSVDAI
jgi:hypothetical protein